MKQEIIRQYKKVPGLTISEDGHVITTPLPSDDGKREGKLITVFTKDGILFNKIDINSTTIPRFVEDPVGETNELKINYCAGGRCELRLKSGECTYLTAGEIAVDAGQALNTYYYPGGEYRGFEVVVSMQESDDKSVLGDKFVVPKILYENCAHYERPWIRNAGRFLAGFHDSFSYYLDEQLGSDLIYIKCVELITYLSKLDFEEAQLKRTYYTTS